MDRTELAGMIDHTLLRPDAASADILRLCSEAVEFRFYAVCIAPAWVPLAVNVLKGSGIRVATVVGFPLGSTFPEVKVFETEKALSSGAEEFDMVIPVGLLKEGDEEAVLSDILGVVQAAKKREGSVVKVIIETVLLTDAEKTLACRLAEQAGADFVKTSTGSLGKGATPEDITLLRRTVGGRMKIKASGGIRDLGSALALVSAGADRLGCSASVRIMKEFGMG